MKKIILIIISLAIIAVIVVVVTQKADLFSNTDTSGETPATVSTDQSVQALLSQPFSEIYTDDAHRFKVSHPVDLVPSSFADDSLGGDVVTITDGLGNGMQIVITPFDEAIEVLTAERIKQDQPDLIIRNPQEVILGSSGKGVAFLDAADDASSQRQIWFIAGGSLYQITAPFVADTLVQKMLNTWEFF